MNQRSLGSILVVNGCKIIGRRMFNSFNLYLEVEPDESAKADEMHIYMKVFWSFITLFG